MNKLNNSIIFMILGIVCESVIAVTPRWVGNRYQYVAEGKPLKDVLRDFASSQSMTFSMSSDIEGTVAGRFDLRPENFISMLSRSYGFSWYYDGVVLHVSSAKDINTRLLKLQSVNTLELRNTLERMGLLESRFPVRFDIIANTAIVQGPSQYVELVVDIAAQLEERSSKLGSSVVRIFRLTHARATDQGGDGVGAPKMLGVASLMRNIYKVNSTPTDGTDREKFRQSMTRMVVGEEPLASASANKLNKLQNSREPEMSGNEWWDSHQKVISPKSSQGYKSVPNALNNLSATKVGADIDLPVIIADAASNSVFIRDWPERMKAHEDFISKLDVKEQQIEIEIHILEIQREALDALGVDWRLHGDSLDAQTGGGKTTQLDFSGALPGVAGAAVSSPAGGALTAVLGNAGGYLLARITALQQRGLARVSARPKVATLNNQQATMSSEQIMHVKVEAFQSAQLFSITTGTVMRVTPTANLEADGWRIKLDVHVKDGRALESVVSGIPVTTESRIDTQAVVGNGESLLLGGYEVENENDKTSGIPGLSTIPIFAKLFNHRSVSNNKFQRLFLVSPRILP